MRFSDWLEEQRGDSDYLFPEFIYGSQPEDEWYVVHNEHVDSRRWYEVYLVVCKHRTYDEYWGFYLSDPSTEMQEFYWDDCIDTPFRVKPEEKTVIVYNRV